MFLIKYRHICHAGRLTKTLAYTKFIIVWHDKYFFPERPIYFQACVICSEIGAISVIC